MRAIPHHLLKYTTEQDYSVYTHEDQAVWRFIMKQLFHYLKDHAHKAYVEGLSKTGISVERIPSIKEMDEKLSHYGWRAVPVSGFIPPAAFMSFQAHRILPIASEMRSIENVLYTPAPDIVHEASGHAPILIDQDFTDYLGAYADVAAKAIISSEDLALYEAIRDLSDLKEATSSTPDDIKKAEEHLNQTSKAMTYVSEAQLLGRMNWWTAEYGLIGELNDPKIFGAGLLSSIGESRKVFNGPKHVPFDVKCLDYTYDITEQQPQLFVAKNFESLIEALKEMSLEMAFTKGGKHGLDKAVRAKSVCTLETSNQKTYSGVVTGFKETDGVIKSVTIKSPCLVDNETLLETDTTFEMQNGETVLSVYGGPSSFEKYPQFEDFAAKKITKNSVKCEKTEDLLKRIRTVRENEDFSSGTLDSLKTDYFKSSSTHWLAALELLEITKDEDLKTHLISMRDSVSSPHCSECISLGLSLLN